MKMLVEVYIIYFKRFLMQLEWFSGVHIFFKKRQADNSELHAGKTFHTPVDQILDGQVLQTYSEIDTM